MTITAEDGIKLNQMRTKARLIELLDNPKKYKDIIQNNINVLFPFAEYEATYWEGVVKSIKRDYPHVKYLRLKP